MPALHIVSVPLIPFYFMSIAYLDTYLDGRIHDRRKSHLSACSIVLCVSCGNGHIFIYQAALISRTLALLFFSGRKRDIIGSISYFYVEALPSPLLECYSMPRGPSIGIVWRTSSRSCNARCRCT